MIRMDFANGGFPINKRCPVFCITNTGDIFIAYNRYTLNFILKNKAIKKCVGIWPGKINTDCFPLQIKSYLNMPLPPARHQSIDDSPEIKIFYWNKELKKITYTDELSDGRMVEVESEEKSLMDYVIKSGLKHSNIYL